MTKTRITGDWKPTRTTPMVTAGPLTALKIGARRRMDLVLETLHAVEELTTN